jgi:glycerol-3-phosphate acyltransferase PlsY
MMTVILAAAVLAAAIIVYRHRDNPGRLAAGDATAHGGA